jgi:hypothetical protein
MLDDRPFRLRDIRVGNQRPRSHDTVDWSTPFRGVRVPSEHAADVTTRIRAAALLVPPDAAISGWAAAWLNGDPWATGRTASGEPVPVLVVGPRPHAIRETAGLKPRRSTLAADDVVLTDGMRVVAPLRAGFDIARYGRTLAEVVPPLDSLLRTGVVDVVALEDYVRRHPRMRGVPLARQAVALASPFSESRAESQMRMAWHGIGIPRPVVNATILDESGLFVGRVDLLDAESGVVGEYQGDHHRSPEQYRADVARRRRLESLGLIVVEAAGGDFRPHSNYLNELAIARSRGLRRNRAHDRWQVGPRRPHI